jgi:hypothetical protein
MANKKLSILVAAVIATVAGSLDGRTQSTKIFVQDTEAEAPREMTAAERAKLQDPLFKLVISRSPEVIRLTEILTLIQPAPLQRRLFVVDEQIKSTRTPAFRRSVIDFTGSNPTLGIGLDGKVMLSIGFSSSGMFDTPEIEAWAFDDQSGNFNFYKLDQVGSGLLSWKLRGSSQDAATLPATASAREGRCVRCHTSGVPIMKELAVPWNNWDSNKSPNPYLHKGSPTTWPVLDDPKFIEPSDAYLFEGPVENAIRLFNLGKFGKMAKLDGEGHINVEDAKAMVRPLFDTTEVNLTSARQQSGLHPLSPDPQNGPTQDVVPPDSFFLLESTISDLGINEVFGFGAAARVTAQDYKTFVANEGLKIFIRGRPPAAGDTNFAWFTPELGFAAVNWISMLRERKILSPAFMAAVLAVDHKTPIFSERRKSLLDLIPATLSVSPGEAHPDQLTRDVIARIQATNPSSGSAAAEFLDLLRKPDPVQELRSRVIAYRTEVQQIDRSQLFKQLVQRRKDFLMHPMFKCLRETDALFAISESLRNDLNNPQILPPCK